MDLGIIHRKAEGCRGLQELIFVLDAGGEVNPVRQLPDRRLEDVCGRRRTMWLEPATVEPEQRGFLLAAGDRNAELVFAGEAQRGLREALQQLLNRRLVQRLAVDGDVAMACAIATVGVVAAAVVVVVAAGIDCRMGSEEHTS